MGNARFLLRYDQIVESRPFTSGPRIPLTSYQVVRWATPLPSTKTIHVVIVAVVGLVLPGRRVLDSDFVPPGRFCSPTLGERLSKFVQV
jgi:hypothetical protein